MRRMVMLAIAGLVSLPSLAVAQQTGTYKARLEPEAKNIGVCMRLDTALRREHTLTVTAKDALVVGAGGVKAKMKPAGAKVYQNGTVQIGGDQFVIVADLSRKPGTLVVTDSRMGCRWSGELTQ